MSQTYLTTDELASRIKYNARTIRNALKDSVLIEGRHYVRPFGGRKILYIWEHIEQDMFSEDARTSLAIPMANGQTIKSTALKGTHNKGVVIPLSNGGACHV